MGHFLNKSFLIGLGGNLGEIKANFASVLNVIDKKIGRVVSVSRLYQTAALTHPDHLGDPPPDYLNCAFQLQTQITPQELLAALNKIERQHGRIREREIRWQSRTVDLDILLFSEGCVNEEDLKIPHPGILDRLFVLAPLNDIAPNWLHPHAHQSISFLLQQRMAISRQMQEPLPQLLKPEELGPLRSWHS